MIKKLLAVALALVALVALAGLALGCGGNEESSLPKDVVAKVGNTSITKADFDKRVAEFKSLQLSRVPDEATDPEGWKDFQRSVLNYMVALETVKQKSAELEVSVSDQDVQKEIDSIKQNSFGGDQAKFDEALKTQNLTLDQLKANLREQLTMQGAYEAVTKDAEVPDADIQKFYDENKDSFAQPETRKARHILIAPTSSSSTTSSTTSTTGATSSSESTTSTTAAPTEADWAAAKAEADKVYNELKGGADFAAQAKQYSDDPGSKDSGGELGVVSKGQMVPEFETALFALKNNGDLSEPVKTQYGWHIIQVQEITPAKQYTLEEVKPQINSQLLNQKKEEVWQAWLDKTEKELNTVIIPELQTTTTTTEAPSPSSTATSGASSSESTTSTSAAATTTTAKK